MKHALKLLVAFVVVTSIAVGGVAAQEQENEFEQEANADVDQYQEVAQMNVNVQDDNTAVAAGAGDATAVQAVNPTRTAKPALPSPRTTLKMSSKRTR